MTAAPDTNEDAEDFDNFFHPDHAKADIAVRSGIRPQGRSGAGTNPGTLPVPPRLGLLATLSGDQFDVVARSAQLHFVEPGQYVFRQGDAGDRFFVLMEGQVEIIKGTESVATLGPGSFFGEGSLLTGNPRSADVRTTVQTALWSIDRVAFETALGTTLLDNPETAAEIQRRMSL